MAKPTNKEFRQSRTEAPQDFLEQYLTFDTADAEDCVFLNRPSMLPDEAGYNERVMQHGLPVCSNLEGCTIRASSSAHTLLSLKSISLHSPEDLSPPSSPQAPSAEISRGRRRNPKRRSFLQLKEPASSLQRKSSPIRKATCPPKMIYQSCYGENIQDLRHGLALGKFDFGFPDSSIPLSPPPSARISDSSDRNSNRNIASRAQQDEGPSWDRQMQQQFAYTTHENMDSPLITPPADISNFQSANFRQPHDIDAAFVSHQSQYSSTWTPDALHSVPFDSSTTYVSEEESAPLQWSHASTVPLIQPSPNTFHRHSSQNSKSLAMELQAELAQNANELALSPSIFGSGPVIQMPGSPSQKSLLANCSPSGNQPHSFYTAASSQPHRYAHRHTQSQPPSLKQENEFSALSKHRSNKSQSRTQSTSPPSPRTRSSSFHVSKQRRSVSRKRGDQGGTIKTPKPAPIANLNGLHDFVNFTPNDSRKILTGVAPSGSSKTKARREKEAMEKSRRLSQAAVRAVRAAGGSIQGLVEEGLFEPPSLSS